MKPLRKYPRTRHIEGSRLQPGDEDLAAVPWRTLAGRHLAIEEKVDGANAALSFDDDGALLLQSRGHYLTGGVREKHFAAFKTWARALAPRLFEVLGSRYVVYGEWLYAKHTIFYDALPHYFLEFDVLDREHDRFLSTPRRRALLAPLALCSVPVLHEGPRTTLDGLVGPSTFKTPRWRDHLAEAMPGAERRWRETDPSDEMEGLYIKLEDADHVLDRFKWVRASFLTSVVDSGTHWLARPIVPNRLAEGASLDALFS